MIEGNLIGTDAAGTVAIGNQGNGVIIVNASGNWVGVNSVGGATESAAQGNLISGNLDDGIEIESNGNVVAGNMVGTDNTGTIAVPNGVFGVVLSGGSNTIGGTTALAQNLISGNTSAGIQISSSTATGNVVEGNRIGTTLDGTQTLGNGAGPGVIVEYFATGNTVGGTAAGAANLISGNADGELIIYGHGTVDNVVAGNLIGTNADGTLAVAGESGAGVKIYGGAAQNTIGGTASGAGNLISGNDGDGVQIIDGYQDYVQGNRIGLDRSGTGALANTDWGISLSQHFPSQTTSGGYTTSGPGSLTGSNVIGGTGSAARNVVSGNGGGGIYITSGIMDLVAGNYVGVDPTGTFAIPDVGFGIYSQDGTGNTIGGTVTGSGNVVASNYNGNIVLIADTADVVAGNLVGTDATGTVALGGGGVQIEESKNTTVGGTVAGARNVISGNNGDGVAIVGQGATHNLVEGNYIGTDLNGTVALANQGAGVDVYSGASNVTIGGTAPGAGNVISGNAQSGILLQNSPFTLIVGNKIGTDESGGGALPNSNTGIDFEGGGFSTIGGTTAGAGNLVSGNDGSGILLDNAFSFVVQGNLVGTNFNGSSPLPNTGPGLDISQSNDNTIGGTSSQAINLFSGNDGPGVIVEGSGSMGNVISGNHMQHDSTGVLIENAASQNTIGGTAAGAGNIITSNPGDGIAVGSSATDASTGNALLGNAIFSNGLGIDLGSDGVTLNDSMRPYWTEPVPGFSGDHVGRHGRQHDHARWNDHRGAGHDLPRPVLQQPRGRPVGIRPGTDLSHVCGRDDGFNGRGQFLGSGSERDCSRQLRDGDGHGSSGQYFGVLGRHDRRSEQFCLVDKPERRKLGRPQQLVGRYRSHGGQRRLDLHCCVEPDHSQFRSRRRREQPDELGSDHASRRQSHNRNHRGLERVDDARWGRDRRRNHQFDEWGRARGNRQQ